MYQLRLYVSGRTPKALRTIRDFTKLMKEQFEGQYSLKVIDLLETPQLAEKDKILATPTVVKLLPLPVRRIIGDLSDREKVLAGLDLVN